MSKYVLPGFTCRLTFGLSCWLGIMDVIKTSKIQVQILTVLPGLFSLEICLQAVEVCYPDYVQNIVKDQSFWFEFPGYPS